jgi:signal transduction histidine kinase/HPt (histidine-containing phosphotransfer) domain-containing protein
MSDLPEKNVFDRPYPVPSNEVGRLDALRRVRVLDTPPEPAFDDLVHVVAAMLGVPMALLSLIDEHRQWFKARVGLEITETPRGLAICSHAISDDAGDVLVVKDMRDDRRFADHPSVTTDPGMRFYAGAPLVTSDGFALGTLCVVDNRPRELTPEQLTVLRALARQAVAQLELRRYTEELRAAHEELREVDRRKSEFVGTVAHELRTPLTSIGGALRLLEAGVVGKLDEEPQELVRIARSNTDRLIRLVNDYLDLERIEAKKMELVLEPVAPRTIVEAAVDAARGMADAASVTIACGEPPDVRVLASPDRAVQVLVNLLSNAVKFSSPGGRVLLDAESTAAGVTFHVRDHGPGMSAEQSAKLFEKFQRLDETHTRGKSGTGLGLAISRALAREMRGDLGCDSEVGVGSVFHFTLPCDAIHAPDVTSALAELLVTYSAELPLQIEDMAARLAKLRSDRTEEPWKSAHRLAHTLRGTAGSYGLAGVSEAAATLVKALEHVQPEGAEPDASRWLAIDAAFADLARTVKDARGEGAARS